MMTSRAEYRLHLRQDNADLRLTELGYKIGLAGDKRYDRLLKKRAEIDELTGLFNRLRYRASDLTERGIDLAGSNKVSFTVTELIKMGTLIEDIRKLIPNADNYMTEAIISAVIDVKYAGYLEKEVKRVQEEQRLNDHRIPDDIDYDKVDGLRIEAREKLKDIRPMTLGQASRISGVNSADITVLLIYLKKKKAE